MSTYEWTVVNNKCFEFITDNQIIYQLLLKDKYDHSLEFCKECEDMYEIHIKCITDNPPSDNKVKDTIISILKQLITKDCCSILYVCDNSDNRADCRERLFNKWIDSEDVPDSVDKYVKQYCEDTSASSCLNLNLIADKNCGNFEENLEDFLF